MLCKPAPVLAKECIGKGMLFLRSGQVSDHSSANTFLCLSLNRPSQPQPLYFSCASTTRKPRVFHRVSGGTGLHDRRMGVATARPSISVRQAPWPANVLAVGRFGGGRLGAPQRLRRQTHPTYAQSAAFMPNLLLMRQHDTEAEGVPPCLRWHGLAGGGK